MHKKYQISASTVALTAVLTTSILSACSPAKQQVADNKQISPLPVVESGLILEENDLSANTLTIKKSKPKISKSEMRNYEQRDKLTREKMQAASSALAGRALLAERRVSSMFNSVLPMQAIRTPNESLNRENYNHFDDNQIKLVAEAPVSTFSIDVDAGSYSNVRRMINSGNLPQEDAVRVEELVNYFSYDYPLPEKSGLPFSVTTELGVTPWNADTRLLHIGIKGYDVSAKELPASNLVFLIDVSGSMKSPAKLGLLKSALNLLTKQMRSQDRISIVVYAGASGVVLKPVAGNQSAKIAQALASLSAGGSTNGAAGIRSAYLLAEQEFIKGGINRVILATDGDFNVGTVNFEALKDLVKEKRKTGVSLTTLGFGSGNYNDHLMEQLADAGNGNYSYIDTLNEAQKVLVDEMSSTLNTIAKDVKIQLEFNPDVVAEYRLIGYENRALNREDFNNDNVDAGEIGAGHTVTALYEITLVNSKNRAIDTLRYTTKAEKSARHVDSTDLSNELAYLRLRYKDPEAVSSQLIEQVINVSDIQKNIKNTSNRFRFSASVAGFAQLLRGGRYTQNFVYDDVLELARDSRGKDDFGYRGEFLSLVNLTKSLSSQRNDDIQASR